MYFYATDLEISERSRVDDHMIELRMGPITVVDIVRKYNLDGLRPFFTGQTRALVESLDQVRIEAESHSAAIISAMRGD